MKRLWEIQVSTKGSVEFLSQHHALRIVQKYRVEDVPLSGSHFVLYRFALTSDDPKGEWKEVARAGSLEEILVFSDWFPDEAYNPQGICSSLWHNGSHEAHSSCPQCGRGALDDTPRTK